MWIWSRGYFIIGGGEKVIIAQERMATNFVYVSKKIDPSNSFYQAEIRSCQEGSNYPPHLFLVKIMKKKNFKFLNEILITAKIHYVNEEIPISILFGALGIQNDRDIMEHIIFDEKLLLLKSNIISFDMSGDLFESWNQEEYGRLFGALLRDNHYVLDAGDAYQGDDLVCSVLFDEDGNFVDLPL